MDRDQDMHPWRDWVLAAFNWNMRYVQFTIPQHEGDRMPGTTRVPKVTPGVHRNTTAAVRSCNHRAGFAPG